MGSSGIKRRKKRRASDTPPEERISEGDVGRLFGRFNWDPLTPAGGLERNGFFLRQLRRRRRRDGWTVAGYAFFMFSAIAMALVVIGSLVAVIVNVLR